MKRKITQAEYDALSEALQAIYKKDGDSWLLQIEGDTTFETLKAEKAAEKAKREAVEAELQERKDAETVAAEKLRKETEKAAKASGDMEALEKSWKEKRDSDVANAHKSGNAATAALKTVYVDAIAREMANAISTVPDLLFDLIKKRLDLEIHDGVPITRVVSADGKPSALSVADLRKEFVDNADYAAIIKSSDAQGGGAGGADGGAGGAGKKLSEMTATEEAQYANAHPEAYKRMIG